MIIKNLKKNNRRLIGKITWKGKNEAGKVVFSAPVGSEKAAFLPKSEARTPNPPTAEHQTLLESLRSTGKQLIPGRQGGKEGEGRVSLGLSCA